MDKKIKDYRSHRKIIYKMLNGSDKYEIF